jgi:hypothetical protein
MCHRVSTVKLRWKRRGVSLNSLIVDALEKETHHAAWVWYFKLNLKDSV